MAKILYIEDIEDNSILTEKILASYGHEFIGAKNAEEGLAMALKTMPELILLDLGLPDFDGQTLAVWLRNEPSLKGIPIIVLTAWTEEIAQHTVASYNLDGYVCKPFTRVNLMKVINEALGRQNAN